MPWTDPVIRTTGEVRSTTTRPQVPSCEFKWSVPGVRVLSHLCGLVVVCRLRSYMQTTLIQKQIILLMMVSSLCERFSSKSRRRRRMRPMATLMTSKVAVIVVTELMDMDNSDTIVTVVWECCDPGVVMVMWQRCGGAVPHVMCERGLVSPVLVKVHEYVEYARAHVCVRVRARLTMPASEGRESDDQGDDPRRVLVNHNKRLRSDAEHLLTFLSGCGYRT
ncbi:hypothetical protein Pmani_032101 [Petrolisthes manimaculis]|uniref:Uncharacterized protein n=1 Tax=Petrolisthes manimaculis TaxID=1843537 RepID=A0AAE1TRC0_9EUCA|nr:hypothetical protein Pmani_032101 [Petrolisthes manimaculis]